MAASHTTLLELLGKHITYDLVVDHSFDQSGYLRQAGLVTGVLALLDGDHQLLIVVDGYPDNSDFIKLSEVKILN